MAETYKDILASASTHLSELSGHVFDLLTVEKPISIGAAVNLSKVISKLSPLLGNLIEFNTVEFLNGQPEYKNLAVCRALACQVLQITEFPLFYDLALGRGENTKTPKISSLRLLAPESPTVC